MSTKVKFWGMAAAFILFLWVFAPDQDPEDIQYPKGTVSPTPADNQPANPADLPSPMYADQAFQRLIDSGAIHALKGVKLGNKAKSTAAAVPPAPPVASITQDGKPATFRTQTIRFQTKRGVLPLIAGMADTPELRGRGLMFYRTWPAKMHGVLFLSDREEVFSMWMKNTFLPLDMVFMNKAGTVVHIAENTATESESLISSQQPASTVLEVPAGAAKLWQISIGDKLLPLTP